MSLVDIRTYARARMRTLGYKEWTDGFNFENIPKTLLDSNYHIETPDANVVVIHQDNQHMECPLIIRIFKAPTLRPKGLIDDIDDNADEIIEEFLAPENRLTQTGIKNVFFNTKGLEPLDASDDNGVICKIAFTMLVVISTRRGA